MCGDADIQPRQKNREEKRDVFQPARERGVKRTVCIIVGGLKVFNEEIRHVKRCGCAVYKQPDAPLMQFAA